MSNSFNQSRELKGQVVRLNQVKESDDMSIEVTAGWGANIKGSWRKGIYSVEVVFMDQTAWCYAFRNW